MTEATAPAERPPRATGGTAGIAVFSPMRGAAHADAAFAALLAPPAEGESLERWLARHGAAPAAAATALRLNLRGHGGIRVEAVLAHLPDGQAVVTALPGRPEPEQGYDDVLDASSEWFWEMDASLRFRAVSQRFGVIAGIPPEAVLGRTRAEFVGAPPSPEDAEKLRRHLAELEARRPFRNFVYPTTSHGGRRLFFRVSGEPRFAADGAFLGYVGVGAVATEHVAVREILEEVPIPLLVCRLADGAVLHLNTPAAARFADAATAADCFADPADYTALAARAEAGRHAPPEVRLRAADGAVSWAQVSAREMIFGGGRALLIGLQDVTERRAVQEALRSRGNDLRAILDAGPVGVLITAAEDDEVLFANARCAEILAVPKAALIGGPADPHFAERDGRARLLEALSRNGRVHDVEVRMRRGGRVFWALVSVEDIVFDNRRAALFWIYDISERRQVEEEHRKLLRAVHHSPASVVITDRDGRIEYVNPRFCQITGYAAEEVLGRNPNVCKSGMTEPAVYADLWRTIRAGRPWQGELLNRRRDGSLYWEAVLIAPIPKPDGEITHFVAVKSDVTAHKEAERALVEAKERAEDAARAKSEFLAMMSHEIRTPMNGILGMINLLRETRLDERQRDFAETARASSEALLSILNDILDFSKLEARQMKLESVPLDLHGLIEGVVGLMRARAEEKGLALDLALDASTPARVTGDPARLRQVLLNLLSNAIKFTERGSVRLRAAAGRAGVRFEVADTGIGVAPEVRAKLFSEFVQADSTIARRFGGTGLGLAICRKIVTLMGGGIGLDSQPGQGSVFWFEVPLPAAPPAPPAACGDAEERNGGDTMGALNILLAEDNPVNQKVATALLGKQGHSVSVAKDGFEAVAAIAEGGFDLVLMDVQMPGLDGFEATRRIRALPDGKGRLPIIAMTANALKGDEQRCREAGMDDYVPKPIHPQALYAAIERQGRQPAPRPDGAAPVLDPGRLRGLEDQVGTETTLALLGDCVGTLPGYVSTAEAAAAAGDTAGLRNAAHDVKSLAATFGLTDLAALALDIETAAREGRAADAGDLRHRLDAALAALRRLYPTV